MYFDIGFECKIFLDFLLVGGGSLQIMGYLNTIYGIFKLSLSGFASTSYLRPFFLIFYLNFLPSLYLSDDLNRSNTNWPC